MPSISILNALGLNFSPNQLDAPNGSLVEASNIIIDRDNVIESRRGFHLYGTEIGTSTDRCKQLLSYKGKLLRHFANRIQYENGVDNVGTAAFFDFKQIVNGNLEQAEINEAWTGIRIKAIEANSNLYLTSSDGIKKISAKSADTFAASPITKAGGIKALDAEARLVSELGNQSGFLSSDSGVAYKVLWGIKDANKNLIVGTPSNPATILNPLILLVQKDFSNFLLQLDNVASSGNTLIGDTNYYSNLAVDITSSSSVLRTNLISLSKKLDEDLLFATDAGGGGAFQPLNISGATTSSGTITVSFSAGTPSDYFRPGDNINLSGFLSGSVSPENFNTDQVITLVGGSTIQMIAKNYSPTDPSGIGGPLSFPALGGAGNLVITSASHGLKNGQKVTISGATATVNGTYSISYLTPDTFQISISGATIAGTGIWNTVIDSITSSKIESHLFRSIKEPVEQSSISTNSELLSIQQYFSDILTELQGFIEERAWTIVNSTSYGDFLENIKVTSSARAALEFTIPSEVLNYSEENNPYFYQIYRTSIAVVTGVSSIADISIIQEYYQIEEKFPTQSELDAGSILFDDQTPESIAGTGAYLYTNERSGEGGLQANDIPPFSTDIAVFKGYTFFSSTKTRQRKLLSLIGVSSMVDLFNPADPYKLTISDGERTKTYAFVKGSTETTKLTCTAASVLPTSGAGKYFLLNSANDKTEYYVWYQVGATTDPATTDLTLSGKTGIKVVLKNSDLANVVAQKTRDAISSNMTDFMASVASQFVTITTTEEGIVTEASAGTLPAGFVVQVTQPGQGEDETADPPQVLLSSISSSLAIEKTAKSLIKVINRTSDSDINGFYISGVDVLPGSILLESKEIRDEEFFIVGSNSTIGASFNPVLSPGSVNITEISEADPTVITTSTPHDLLNGDKIIISGSSSTPTINGVHEITWLSPTSFSLDIEVTDSGSGTAVFSTLDVAESSSNEDQPHRVYFSKYQKPEAVPITNYLDIGATDKEILRIFPLRDSLFVFKEDGLYRISGEVAPFSVALFDSSCILLAPDSVSLSNNQVYAWTTQGISTVTEAGVTAISRPLNSEILNKGSSLFTNFKTATWGVGYESDNSYTVYTTADPLDDAATVGFRYSTQTRSWTTVAKSATCGIINPVDDKMYLGAGDTNSLEKERKEFTRYDYADREFEYPIVMGGLSAETITMPTSVRQLSVGDVLVQDQTLTVYEYNMLLKKLDIDPGVPSSDYYATLAATAGDYLKTKLLNLAAKLDDEVTPGYEALISSKSGSITTASIANPSIITTSSPHGLQTGRFVSISGNTQPEINGIFKATYISPTSFSIPVDLLIGGVGGTYVTDESAFDDLKTCYNLIIEKLNSDPIVARDNYRLIDNDTIQEAIIIAKDDFKNEIVLDKALDLVIGTVTIYKAIPCSFIYSPQTMGDPLGLKHLREATVMFENRAITFAELRFSTDLFPGFVSVPFNGDGPGVFGSGQFGLGFFGGIANNAPFRTLIPRQCQRCRYINVGVSHATAREKFSVYGITITGEIGQTTRAYR